MPPERGKKRSTSTSSSSSSARNGRTTNSNGKELAAAGSSGPLKKMGSLSSFQMTLNFRPASPPTSASSSSSRTSFPSTRPNTSAGTSSSTHSRSSNSSKEEDRKRMPPPPPGTRAKLSHTTDPKSNASANGKGKQKAIIEILSDDDEDEVPSAESGQMWTELYAPTNETDLAPGKARIQRVKNWLHEALFGHPIDTPPPPESARERSRKYKRVLLLSGPAGTGKTTTVRLLAEKLGVELVEWSEEVEEWSLGSGIERESSTSKFNSFLSRHSYPSLNLSSQPSPSQAITKSKPRLILLTSLPNLTHLPTREAFHASLLSFCKTFSPSSCPMVIVHSDAGASGRAEESWMERERGGREGALEVLGKDVRDSPWCQEIDFLPLAPTFMTKALFKVMLSALPNATDRVSHSVIQLLSSSSNGDLRSAINSLQLLCGKRKDEVGKKVINGAKSNGPKKKVGLGSRGGKGAKLDVNEDMRAVLDAVTRREQSLGLFHALGKVFYNKRLDDPREEEEDAEVISAIRQLPPDRPLPGHMNGYTRRKSLVQIESFIPTIPVDASSFALWIHQSFPTFCTEIEQCSEGIDDLCAADIMRTDDDIWQSSPQAIAYALHISVRGSLMALPSPVPRKSQKVIKPQFFEAYRHERDNLSALDSAMGYMMKKALVSYDILANNNVDVDNAPAQQMPGSPWTGLIGKSTLMVELIPMMIKIQGLTKRPLLPSSAQSLSLPIYKSIKSSSFTNDELTSKDTDILEEETYNERQEEERSKVWDWSDDLLEKDGEEEEEFLVDDDIEDW